MKPPLLSVRRCMLAALVAAPLATLAQTGGVRIGTPGAPDPSAVLDLQPDAASAPKGFLPPRLTYVQRTAISNAAAGLLVYQSDASTSPAAPAGYYFYTGTQWLPLLSQGDNLGNHTATQNLNLNGNQVLSASRIGVGTATPALGLDVAGGGAAIGVRGASWDHIYLTHDASTAFLNAGGAENGLALRVGNATSGSYGGQTYTEGLRLLASGNVGVGTATPTQKLEVAGQVYSSAGGFRFPDNTVQTTAAAGDNLGNHTATQNLNLGTNQLVGNGGTVGIGISNAGAVQFGTNDTDKLYFTQSSGANGSKLAHSTGWNLDYYAGPNNGAAGTHRFFTGTGTGWVERLRIDASGRVGIGTGSAAPRGVLDVAAPGDKYLVTDPDNGTAGQSIFLPGHLYLAPYSGTSGTAFMQARVPNPTTSTNIGLTLRTTNAGALTDAVRIASTANVALSGDLSVADDVAVTGDMTVAGNVVMGLVTQTNSDTSPANSYSQWRIACPSGTRLLGGGGGHRDFNSAQTDININYSGPDPTAPTTTWLLRYTNDSNSDRAVVIYCNCARIR